MPSTFINNCSKALQSLFWPGNPAIQKVNTLYSLTASVHTYEEGQTTEATHSSRWYASVGSECLPQPKKLHNEPPNSLVLRSASRLLP